MNRLTARLNGDGFFLWSLALTALLKLALAAAIPLTGDEAYYTTYGEHLDFGYYDHGPVIGWWLGVVLALGKTVLLVRLPAVFATLAVGVLLWHSLRTIEPEKGPLAAAVYLWSPHNVLLIFATTDAPLILFSAVAGVFAFHAFRDDHALDYLFAGVFLGLAFLSKYFAVLLGLAFAILFLVICRPPRLRGLLLILVGVLPAAALNLAWNYQHGWINIVFYLYSRQRGNGASVLNILEFVGFTLLLLGPIAWFLLRPRLAGRARWTTAKQHARTHGLVAFAVAFAVPLALLLGVSLVRKVGLHWSLSFFPFLFATLPAVFDAGLLKRMLRAMGVCTGVLALIGAVGVRMPVEWGRWHKSYHSIVLGVHPHEVLAALRPFLAEYQPVTPSYVNSALLSFFAPQRVPVVGLGSAHGRQDDLLSDLRALDGRNLLVLLDHRQDVETTSMWFRESELRRVSVRSAEFRLLLGRGFRFETYRDTVLARVAEEFYRMPSWLAGWSKPDATYLPRRYGLQPEGGALPSSAQAKGP